MLEAVMCQNMVWDIVASLVCVHQVLQHDDW